MFHKLHCSHDLQLKEVWLREEFSLILVVVVVEKPSLLFFQVLHLLPLELMMTMTMKKKLEKKKQTKDIQSTSRREREDASQVELIEKV